MTNNTEFQLKTLGPIESPTAQEKADLFRKALFPYLPTPHLIDILVSIAEQCIVRNQLQFRRSCRRTNKTELSIFKEHSLPGHNVAKIRIFSKDGYPLFDCDCNDANNIFPIDDILAANPRAIIAIHSVRDGTGGSLNAWEFLLPY